MATALTENAKRKLGIWYNANFDPEVAQLRDRCDELCWQFNQTNPRDHISGEKILQQLLPHRGREVVIIPRFDADYGDNCFIGDHTFINRGCYLMDCAPITLGKWCFIGPNCGFYTAKHPLLPHERNQGLEQDKAITLGDNIWVGGHVVFLPGVKVGSGCVIGAGSVVVHDLPADCVAVGNPCRVLRKITERDSIYYQHPQA